MVGNFFFFNIIVKKFLLLNGAIRILTIKLIEVVGKPRMMDALELWMLSN